ncbi:hypothetical protein DFH09DRAFT_1301910 [Mycena vulgaris]|nr:hypothetical protein DFH09DRAFT_1301910 [Mycena vulgaris]
MIFTGHTAIFSPGVSDDMEWIFLQNGGARADDSASANWFFTASMEDEAFISRFKVSAEGDIVPATAVFDLDHPDGPLRLRAPTPPSPFTPKASARWSRNGAQKKRKREHVQPVIDLTGDDDEIPSVPSIKHEEVAVEKISPRKKAKRG